MYFAWSKKYLFICIMTIKRIYPYILIISQYILVLLLTKC